MARTKTNAPERTAQNRRLVEEVSAKVGHKVSVRQAQEFKRRERETPPEMPWQVVDRVVQFDPADCRRVGQVIGHVQDMRVMGGYLQMSLRVPIDFTHTVADAALLSRGHPLLLTMDELFPPAPPPSEPDEDDAP